MQVEQLFERKVFQVRGLSVVEVRMSDRDGIQQVCDFINSVSDSSWEMTPSRLRHVVGSSGKVYALKSKDDTIVGTSSLRESKVGDAVAGEISNLYIHEEYRTVPYIVSLYRSAFKDANKFSFVYCVSSNHGKALNKLLKRIPELKLLFKARSATGVSKLNFYWLYTGSENSNAEEILRTHFKTSVIQTYESSKPTSEQKVLVERHMEDVTPDDLTRFAKYNDWDDIKPTDVYPQFIEKAKNKIRPYIKGGKIKIYRAVNFIGDIRNRLEKKDTIGMFWTFDKHSAQSYRNTNPWAEEYVLEAEIDERLVDWDATLSLNTTPGRGDYEKEIRLFKGTPIRLLNVYMRNHKDKKDLQPIELGSLKSKVFKIRRTDGQLRR